MQVAKSYAVKKLEKILENLNNKVIAIWGLAFKAETDDVREASAIDVCQVLIQKIVKKLQVYDPEGMENFLANVSL
jgi:UDPglucose 6-dehydrogenase